MSLKEFLGPIWDEWQLRDIHTWKRTMANSMWLPCNWKVVLDNFNESYHVPTVHMGATTETNRKEIRGHINTYFKETRFDLSNEGHNRMVMEGGYGVGSTDKEEILLKGGHVSLIAGPNAAKRMWPRLNTWLAPRSV